MCLVTALLLLVGGESPTSERIAPPTTIGEQMPTARDVILKHIDAVNGRDSDADPWAADAEMTAPGGAQATGRDNVIGFIGVFHEAFPDLRLEIEQLLTDGPAAAAEGTLTGTHNGVLHTPKGDVAPTGRAVVLRWAAVYLTDDDTLKSEHLFFDQMEFLGQLGLLPG
jgi:predicted ester cyclase